MAEAWRIIPLPSTAYAFLLLSNGKVKQGTVTRTRRMFDQTSKKKERGEERERERERERQMFQTRFVRVPGTSDVRPAALWLCCFDQTESRLLRDNAMIVLLFAVFKGNGDAEIGPGWSLVVIQGTSDQYAGAF